MHFFKRLIVLILLATAGTALAAAAGLSNPRWKVLVLIYTKADIQYTDGSGVFHHITTEMTAAEEQRSIDATTRFFQVDVPALSSNAMKPLLTIRVKRDPLTNLARYGNCPAQGFWPDPINVAADLDATNFDSAVVIWKDDGWDWATRNWAVLGCYGGLAWPRGTGQTFAGFILRMVGDNNRNVFKHEWGHSILFYYAASNASPTPSVDNHINDTTNRYVHCGTGVPYILIDEYDSNPIPNSIYNNASGFTHDYYSGTTAKPDQPTRCLGLQPAVWATGGPVTKPVVNPGDVVADGIVNLLDIQQFLLRAASSQYAPSFDLDYDGRVTILDVRIAVTLCTKPNCAL